MKHKKFYNRLLLIFSIIFLFCFTTIDASNRYWVADTDGYWNDPANWASSNNGNGGASVPDAGDYVYFYGTGQGDCILTSDVIVKKMKINNYTGVIDLAGNNFTCTSEVKLYTGTIDDSAGSGTFFINSNESTYFYGTMINSKISVVSSKIYFHGSIFNDVSEFEQTGNSTTNSNGGNLFGAYTIITKSGKGKMVFAKQNADVFNADVIFNNLKNGYIQIAHDAGISLFFGDVILNSNNSDGFTFGNSGGYASLSDTSNLLIGNLGFDSGNLDIENTTFNSNDPIALDFTGTASLYLNEGNFFKGSLNAKAEQIELNNSTFKGDLTLEKTGNSNDVSNGNNMFEGDVVLINSGSGDLKLLNSNSGTDLFMGDVSFINRGDGKFYIAHKGDLFIEGNLNIENNDKMFIGDKNGSISFIGDQDQYINNLSNQIALPIIDQLNIYKPSGDLILNTYIEIEDLLTFSYGDIIVDSLNTILFRNNAEVEFASLHSHIVGPVYKEGNDAFEFPIGDGVHYKPISISAPSSNSAVFYAAYISQDPALVFSNQQLEPSIDHISSEEYWQLERIASTSEVRVSLNWDESSGGISNINNLTIAGWDGSGWLNYGSQDVSGDTLSGALSSLNKPFIYKAFTLGSTSHENTLPIQLLYFNTACGEDTVVVLSWATATEINNDYFTIFKSPDGENWKPLAQISGQGNSSVVKEYEFRDRQLENEDSKYFYKISQTDYDGQSEEFEIVSVYCKLNLKDFKVFPNPATDYTNIQFNNVFNSRLPLDIFIYSTSGNLVKKLQYPIAKQRNFLNIDFPELVSGTYYLQVKSGEIFFHTCPIIIK